MASIARRPLLALLAALTTALAVTGCVSIPNAGPVLSYPVTQQTGSQNGQNLQFTTQLPGSSWTPPEIVSGFLIAAAANQNQVARAYMTPAAGKNWDPSLATTYVYQDQPNVSNSVPTPAAAQPSAAAGKTGNGGKKGKTAKRPPPTVTVVVSGKIQAILSPRRGTYAVSSASGSNSSGPQNFTLQKTDDGWRISASPNALLLTQAQFADDYDLTDLYFFDPNFRYLVPDPVYVPLQASASTLTSQLVGYLKSPPGDWLADGATETAFPAGTNVTASLSDTVATVSITGTISKAQRAEISSQLLWTLVGSGQVGSKVKAVALIVNGKSYYPSGAPGNPVQVLAQAGFGPATGASTTAAGQPVYYLGTDGDVYSTQVGGAGVAGRQTLVAKVGAGFRQIAVSADGKYLAALRNGELYMGPLHGPLVRQQGSGYATLSWGPTDNLWTTTGANEQIFVFRAVAAPDSRQAGPIAVTVTNGLSVVAGDPYTALQVAPDGVRVAMILNADQLAFGAIVWQPGTGPSLGSVRIQLSPFTVDDSDSGFDLVTWYGADNVITLGGPDSTQTEYPVNGGTPTSQMLSQSVESITATPGQALIAGIAKDEMIEASNLTGGWPTITTSAGTPVKGISPTYPG